MRFYYGWVIVGLAMLGYALVIGVTMNAFGLFVLPVSTELGLSRAAMNTAFVLINVGNGLLAPFVGRALDRFPARPILLISAASMATGFLILSQSSSLLLCVLALAVLLPFGIDGGAMLTLGVLVARWFKVHRGRAIALSAIGMSLGSVIVPMPMALLIQSYGWRIALLFAGSILVAFLLLAFVLIRERPGQDDIEPGIDAAPEQRGHEADAPMVPASLTSLLGSAKLWLITWSAAIVTGIGMANTITLVPYCVDRGLSPIEATSLLTLVGMVAVVSKLVVAWLADRLNLELATGILFFIGAPVNLLMIFATHYGLFLGCAVLFGITAGTLPALMQSLLANRFGVASYGTVRGLAAPIIALCVGAASWFAGFVFDQTGAYDILFMTFAALQLASSAMMLFSSKARPLEELHKTAALASSVSADTCRRPDR